MLQAPRLSARLTAAQARQVLAPLITSRPAAGLAQPGLCSGLRQPNVAALPTPFLRPLHTSAAPHSPGTKSSSKHSSAKQKDEAHRSDKPSTPVPSSLRDAAEKASAEAAKQAAAQLLPRLRKVLSMAMAGLGKVRAALAKFAKDPMGSSKRGWAAIVEEAKHFWLGFKLLASDIRVAVNMLRRVLHGHALSRRERRLLVRTTSDIFRLVPFSIFVIVPFMEFLLPVALKLFPNMLPSQFRSKLRAEEERKRVLTLRLELASFLQDTAKVMGSKIASKRGEDDSAGAGARELLDVLAQVRAGTRVSNSQLLQVAKLFKDEVTLDNIGRPQLAALARFLKLNPYGTDALLRFQLRNKLRTIKGDDQVILWEGIESLSLDELVSANEERGMRTEGMTAEQLREQLSEWLQLSVRQDVPATLLLLSRAWVFSAPPRAETGELEEEEAGEEEVADVAAAALQASISSLEEDVVSEAVLDAAGADEHGADRATSTALRQMRLDSLEYQAEHINAERAAEEAAANAQRAADEATKLATELAELEANPETLADDLIVARRRSTEATRAAAVAAAAARARYLDVQSVHEREAAMLREALTKASPDKVGSDSSDSESAADTARAAAEAAEAAQAAADITSNELMALETLASESALLRERALLARVKATRMHMQAATMVARGRIGKKAASAPVAVSEEPGHEDGGGMAAHKPAAPSASPAPAAADKAAEPGPSAPSGDAKAAETAKPAAESVKPASMRRVNSMLDNMLRKLEKELAVAEESIGDRMKLLDHDNDGVVTAEELHNAIKHLLSNKYTDEAAAAIIRGLDKDDDGKVTKADLVAFAETLAAAEAERQLREMPAPDAPKPAGRTADADTSESESEPTPEPARPRTPSA